MLEIAVSTLAFVTAAFLLIGSGQVLFLAIVGVCTKPKSPAQNHPPRTKFLVLVPAHDEEAGIAPTLASLRQLEYPPELVHVVVIADNCSDDSAGVVERAGYECWVRTAPDARGKGQALQWALSRAAELEFDAVAMVDADTKVEPNFLIALNDAVIAGAEAMQVRYDFEKTGEPGHSHSELSALGKDSETVLFWRPRQRLKLGIILHGNGCAFTRDTLRKVPWSAYSIVEDLEFSLDLAINGIRVQFIEASKVVARSTSSSTEALPQRLRWASGTFQVAAHCIPRLLRAAIRQRKLYLLELAVAVALLSRVQLLYLTVLAVLLSWAATTTSIALVVRLMIAASVLMQVCYVCLLPVSLPEHFSGRWYNLALLPLYVAWIVAVQCMALIGFRRNVWARTVR